MLSAAGAKSTVQRVGERDFRATVLLCRMLLYLSTQSTLEMPAIIVASEVNLG